MPSIALTDVQSDLIALAAEKRARIAAQADAVMGRAIDLVLAEHADQAPKDRVDAKVEVDPQGRPTAITWTEAKAS